MDATKNPFAPGAGHQPPELAGRDKIINDATVALGRVKLGRPVKSQMLLGLRGVGKTVLLNRIASIAEGQGYQAIMMEAPEGKRLAEILVPHLRQILLKLSRMEQAKEVARRGLGVLRSFAKAVKVKMGEIEVSIEPETGTADSGSLETDLPEVLLAVANAAHGAGSAVALCIDEVQYLTEPDLAALIVSCHKMAQKNLPLVVFGAGLPQIAALAGEAKSYSERLFDYPPVGALTDAAARDAVATPIRREDAEIDDEALTEIVQRTRGYPYFLQEWGSHAWNVAAGPRITRDDVMAATAAALTALDESFFKVRLDRLTPREKDYVRAMAELGPGPHRSGEIAKILGLKVNEAGSLRDKLIKKGMIYSPQHGDTAFTVPMFDDFMKRSMPDWNP